MLLRLFRYCMLYVLGVLGEIWGAGGIIRCGAGLGSWGECRGAGSSRAAPTASAAAWLSPLRSPPIAGR